MRVVTAVVFPWFTFLARGRRRDARICMTLQLTVIGWIPATLWALRAHSGDSS
ncbi:MULTISPECIES: YqaE/Pmp3 family membrane protein [unclassified Caballeronia]|uniref:YqaE/Pmp3 family membrane protein n=1 Tax=unclassified Caballeronia TaxID=2646786 RepID=UPI00285CBE73|nr:MULTISPECIES: YqaE/Pmp3 family membrane protein [unclassified Caballeronia]MDR5776993.1 YqaE/Pmp3 family membrane protein [Caballeronia sp. LZ002]MDR5852432.1 YqaE/Pmp3 family membrane protein [Caballeronia sp. LZ003]